MAAAGSAVSVQIADGVLMPRVGLGTFKARGEECRKAVLCALQCGIRHIDTASIYKNEAEVGSAVAEAIRNGLPREDIFITSKISPYEQGTVKAREACESSLHALGLAYVDLMLIHWPGVSKMAGDDARAQDLRLQTWKVLEDFQLAGKVRAIGVSNFEIHHLEYLLANSAIRPAVNQVELHPLYQQVKLRSFCAREGIQVVAYSSFACGHLLHDETVAAVAKANGINAPQALLVWALKQGLCVIPKSVNPERIPQFRPSLLLSSSVLNSDVSLLNSLGPERKFCWDPSCVTV